MEGYTAIKPSTLNRVLVFRGSGFRGSGFGGLGFRGLGFYGLGFRA